MASLLRPLPPISPTCRSYAAPCACCSRGPVTSVVRAEPLPPTTSPAPSWNGAAPRRRRQQEAGRRRDTPRPAPGATGPGPRSAEGVDEFAAGGLAASAGLGADAAVLVHVEIGRASCRER